MITNEFEFGFDDDLSAKFGLDTGFIKTTSITPSKFMYGLDEFKGEIEEDLEALLGLVSIGVASILPIEYGKFQDVEELEGNYSNSIVGDEYMLLSQDFCSNGVFKHPTKVTKAHLRPLNIKALIEGKLINRVLIDGVL